MSVALQAVQAQAALAQSGPPSHALFRSPATMLLRTWAPLHARRLTAVAAAALAGETAAAAPPPAAAAAAASPPQQLVRWEGLHAWRAGGVDERVVWATGPRGHGKPVPVWSRDADATTAAALAAAAEAAAAAGPPPASLADAARLVLSTPDPLTKAALSWAAWRRYKEGGLPVGQGAPFDAPPARPERPELVPPRSIPPMDRSPLPKSAYMLHNLAHVELNAVDLAWDTLLRFSGAGLPEAFYADFAR